MLADFSLIYEPQDKYVETGYHTTLSIYKDSILKEGFKLSTDDDDWLGKGVYFWDSIKNARWWKKGSSLSSGCILECCLSCKSSEYFNLDADAEMRKFEEFSKQYLCAMAGTGGKKPHFKNNNQRKKFFCDIYCSHNNISILAFTFEHNINNCMGFKTGARKRRQICVRNPECISKVSVKE